RRCVAWVPQVPGLIDGTVRDNVTIGADTAGDADVLDALHEVGLPMDLDRVLHADAADLSAGERRRLGLARALVRVRCGGSWLVLLDEPTAGLDADHEAGVLRAITGLGVTSVVVAHRSQTIAVADRVVTVDP